MRTMSQQEGGKQRSTRALGKVTCRTGQAGITLGRHTHTTNRWPNGPLTLLSIHLRIILIISKRWRYWFFQGLAESVCVFDWCLSQYAAYHLSVSASLQNHPVWRKICKSLYLRDFAVITEQNVPSSSVRTMNLWLWIAISSILLM